MTVKELMSFLERYNDDTVVTVVPDYANLFEENTDIIDAFAIVGSSKDARNFIYLTY